MKELGRRLASQMTRLGIVRRAVRAGVGCGILPAIVWRRLPPGVREIEVQLPSGSFRYAVDPTDPFTRELAWRGVQGPEGASLLAFADLARTAGIVVDVGAHTGLYSLAALASSPSLRCISFEPVDRNRVLLAENLRRNGFAERCEVRREAVSDASGEVAFHVPLAEHPMSGSLDPAGFRGLKGEVRSVPCTSLDDALAGAALDLVKIDVEGFEDRVVAGMASHLANRPVMIVECNPDGPHERVTRSLAGYGYRFRVLDGQTTALTDVIRPDPTETFRNVLCVPA